MDSKRKRQCLPLSIPPPASDFDRPTGDHQADERHHDICDRGKDGTQIRHDWIALRKLGLHVEMGDHLVAETTQALDSASGVPAP